MTKTEKIRKARHDVDLLQSGLEKVSVALENAEEVAEIGEEVRRRAPMIMLSVVGVVVVVVGITVVLRRRHSTNDEPRTEAA